MNKAETVKLFAQITALFPKDKSFAAADVVMVENWWEMLQDIPANVAAAAVKAHAAVSPFAPSISDIRGKSLTIVQPDSRITGEELWSKLHKAIGQYGRGFKDLALKQIPDYARPFADRWYMDICNAEDAGVIRGQFLRAWEAHSVRKREDTILPPSVQGFIAELASGTMLRLEG